MSTTTLYETTPQTGTVSSSNLTSLYSNGTNFTTGLVTTAVNSVNGGTGVTVDPTTGNVVVSIGQDVSTSANVTFANIHATGNLSNNYFTLANSIGTSGQVLTTNGAGATSWTTVSSLGLVNSVTGSGAGISVSPTTGNVIVSNTGVTSVIAGTGISVSGATGAVTINSTSASVPSGTAQGQVLYWDGSSWTANNIITSTAAANRLTPTFKSTDTTVQSALIVTRDYAGSPYSAGNRSAVRYQIASDSQPAVGLGRVGFVYDSTDPKFYFQTTLDDFATYKTLGNIDSTDIDLYGVNLYLGANRGTTPATDAKFSVVRYGATNAYLKWVEGEATWHFNFPLTVEGAGVFNGDIEVSGGDITTTAVTGNIFNTNATLLNIGGNATQIFMGKYSAAPNTGVFVPSLTVNLASTLRAVNNITTTSTATFDFVSTTKKVVRAVMHVVDNVTGEVHVLEALAMKKGTTAYITTYAEMSSASALATFGAAVVAGNLTIQATPLSTNNTTFSYTRISLD